MHQARDTCFYCPAWPLHQGQPHTRGPQNKGFPSSARTPEPCPRGLGEGPKPPHWPQDRPGSEGAAQLPRAWWYRGQIRGRVTEPGAAPQRNLTAHFTHFLEAPPMPPESLSAVKGRPQAPSRLNQGLHPRGHLPPHARQVLAGLSPASCCPATTRGALITMAPAMLPGVALCIFWPGCAWAMQVCPERPPVLPLAGEGTAQPHQAAVLGSWQGGKGHCRCTPRCPRDYWKGL